MINRTLRKIRRGIYELRAYVPGMRFQHRIEKMVGPVGYWKELQQYQRNVLLANGLKPEHALLDLGCGPLQGGLPFIQYLNAAGYTGVDINDEHIAAAYRQIVIHDQGRKNPRLIHSAHFGDDHLAEASFDFIWASQILYILDEPTVTAMLSVVSRRLRPGGKFLGDIINPEAHASVSIRYSDYIPHTLEAMQRMAQSAGLRMRPLGEIQQYAYPARLTLRQSVMLEFTRLN